MRKDIDYLGISVVFFCHDGKCKFLLAKRSKDCRDEQGCWDVGGGAVDVHISIEEAIRKEVKEEYCTEVLKIEFLGYRDVHRVVDGVKTHWLALDFKVKIDPSAAKIGEPHKFDELGWFSPDSFPTPMHSQLPVALNSYKHLL